MAHQNSRSQSDAAVPSMSLLIGPTEPPLWTITLSQLLEQQTEMNPTRQCVVFPEFGLRMTYSQLYLRTLAVALGLLAAGIRKGDHVGILAGNCPAYIELFFASSHVGATLVVLNTTYTPPELKFALKHSECKILFIAPSIGKSFNKGVLGMLSKGDLKVELPELEEVVLLKPAPSFQMRQYDELVKSGSGTTDGILRDSMNSVNAGDVCNLQFTSGTTGNPKAAMLTHRNLVNNGRFVGDRMRLTCEDIVCCPPPLFHCFGLVLGLLAALTHGSSIVFPSETFQPSKVLKSISEERCTALHGVPAMFSSELELLNPKMNLSSLRTGIAAGAPVPRKMMMDLQRSLNLAEITITYGMTETSPASFMTFSDDSIEKRLSTVGKILPHMRAKIINSSGDIVPIGDRGELCVAGFALQKGYWKNSQKTAEVMRTDQNGVLWMHTGDEATIDQDGYCRITGRIKDIIIRGGENVFPLEVEERLVQHPSIVQASVVGLPDEKYGEQVCAFLQKRQSQVKPSTDDLIKFVREELGRHKAPVYVFWLRDGEDFPKTGSGKIQKHKLRIEGTKRKDGLLRAKL